ncbi:MAG: peptidylprolyl isomerase, partial [Burkholderiales bacterium]
MKRIWFFVLLAILSVSVHAQEQGTGSHAVLLDRIVAVVNDKVITKLELDEEMQLAMRQLSLQGTPLPPRSILERQVLERMILSSILQQEANSTGIRVSDAQLNSALERMAADNKMTLDQFQSAMKAEGVNFANFREKIRGDIQIARLKEREVDSKIKVSEAEIDSYLRNEASKDEPDKDAEYSVAHILILVPEGAGAEEIAEKREVAEDALKRLKSGADFAQTAAAVSDAPDALEGGMLGWRPPSRLPELFLEAVSKMSIGEVSDLLRSPNGFHIVKLVDKRGGQSEVIVKQTHAR